LLPATDRPAIARALDADPGKRFESCLALVEALEAATPGGAAARDLDRCLPPVIPFTSLQGEPVALNTKLPPVNQIVLDLLAGNDSPVVSGAPGGAKNIRYVLLPGGVWEYKFPIHLFPGAVRLKVDGFRQQWKARLVQAADDLFLFHIGLQLPRRFWQMPGRQPRGLEVRLEVPPPEAPNTRLSEARVLIRPLGSHGDEVARVLEKMAPELFDSMRSYLQPSLEQRGEERWPCPEPLRVYPVLPRLELAEVLEATGKNISQGGVSFQVLRRPPSEHLYLHWHQSAPVRAFAVLARVVRVQRTESAGYEVGASFPTGTPAGAGAKPALPRP
jgi:hypothetical protein